MGERFISARELVDMIEDPENGVDQGAQVVIDTGFGTQVARGLTVNENWELVIEL